MLKRFGTLTGDHCRVIQRTWFRVLQVRGTSCVPPAQASVRLEEWRLQVKNQVVTFMAAARGKKNQLCQGLRSRAWQKPSMPLEKALKETNAGTWQ